MHHRSGGALISAIFITAIVAMLATALAVSQRLLIHEAQLSTRADQLYLQLQGEQLQAAQSIKNYVMQWNNPQSINTQWMPLKNNLPNGVIDDEQGKYNINNLVYSANQSSFVALLQALVPKISKETAFNIAKSITAWETTGSQDAYYLSLNPAYRSSRHELVNISELRLIAGMTPKIYSAIAPFITALPVVKSSKKNMSVDINAASAVTLIATNPTLTLSQAQTLIDCRNRYGGFIDVSQFISACTKQNEIISLLNLTTQSQYFLVKTRTKREDQEVSLNSLMVTQRGKNNTLHLVTVWQEFE